MDSTLLQQIRKIKHVALDMDGTIYNGQTLFPFTIPFLNSLKERGIGYSFLTNNPSKSSADYLHHLKTMGIYASADELYTTSLATIDYLKTNYPAFKRLFILGTPSMINEFETAGFISTAASEADIPDAVVVAFDKTLTYERLCRAAWWIHQKKFYIATNPDLVCPTDQQVVLVDCGSICACLEKSTGRQPNIVMGKPDPNMLTGILNRHQLQPEEIAMVGDRVYTDILMAHRANALGVLVLSGETTREVGEAASPSPDIITENLTGFLDLIVKAQEG